MESTFTDLPSICTNWVSQNISDFEVGLEKVNFALNCRYVLSTIFVPGDRHVLAGLKDGRILIIDIAAGDILEEIPAHSTETWTICLQPDLVSNHILTLVHFFFLINVAFFREVV